MLITEVEYAIKVEFRKRFTLIIGEETFEGIFSDMYFAFEKIASRYCHIVDIPIAPQMKVVTLMRPTEIIVDRESKVYPDNQTINDIVLKMEIPTIDEINTLIAFAMMQISLQCPKCLSPRSVLQSYD